jgi:hypothetical protein
MVSLLHAHGDKLSHGRLQKLAITMAKQACSHRAMAREAGNDVERLEKELTDLRVAEAQALGNDPPEGYVANDNHLPAFLIPDSMGVYGLARYIRNSPTNLTLAFGTMGGSHDGVYATPLQATRFTGLLTPPTPLPAWFTALLGGPLGPFRLLEKEAHSLQDWGLSADIRRARDKYKAADDLRERIYRLEVELEGVQREAADAQGRLEQAFAAKRLHWLEGLQSKRGESLFSPPSSKIAKPGAKHGRGRPSA